MPAWIWVGMREGALLGVLVAVAFLAVGWEWAAGVAWGVGVIAAGRLVRGWLLGAWVRESRGGLAAGLAAFSRQVLVGVLSFGGIALGLEPLAVAVGLLLTIAGRWIWTVRVARALG